MTFGSGACGVPAYEVRLVWHSSTGKDPVHLWMRALVYQLFKRSARADVV